MAGSKQTHTARKQEKAYKQEKEWVNFIPQDALFINTTVLSNAIIKKGCALTVSSVLRMVYFMFGIALGVCALIFRLAFHISTIAFILVLLLGLITIWQGARLPLESARAMIARFQKEGEEARTRICFATEKYFGVIMGNKPLTFSWSQFKIAVASQEITCLVLHQNSVLFILDNEGFSKGTASEFQAFLAQHITTPKRSKFVRWCDTQVYKLDNWKLIQAAYKQEQAQKKAAKKAAKKQRRSKDSR